MEKVMKIAVIGAGASGLTAAVTAAEQGAQVTVYEHTAQAGKKLLMTGNGKCNLTNLDISAECYHTDYEPKTDKIGQILEKYPPRQIMQWFEAHGLLTRSKNGYVYPYCEQASAVLKTLLHSCKQSGVKIRYQYDCYKDLKRQKESTDSPSGKFRIGNESYDRIILACGGKSFRSTGSDGSGYELAKLFGHHVIKPMPALVQLHTDLANWKLLSGVRAQGCVRFETKEDQPQKIPPEQGEIQFTEYGISGIPVFQISRHVIKNGFANFPVVTLDLMPEYSLEQVRTMAVDRLSQCQKLTLPEALTGILHEKLLTYLLQVLDYSEITIRELNQTGKIQEAASRIAGYVKELKVPVTGSHKLDAAQVTQGGIPLHEVDEHLQSKYVKGLYFAGEMLDVDGKCGGYNLHWAWASGRLTGTIIHEGGYGS